MDNFDIKQEYIVQQLNIPKHLIKGLKNIKTNSFYNAKIIEGYFEKPIFIDVDFSNADLNGTMIDEETLFGNTVRTCKNNQICN